jgi:hypothetical protein
MGKLNKWAKFVRLEQLIQAPCVHSPAFFTSERHLKGLSYEIDFEN